MLNKRIYLLDNFYRDFPYNNQVQNNSIGTNKKNKKLVDKTLPRKVRDLFPESEAYMDLLTFEKKLDSIIARKRLDIQVMNFEYFQKLKLNYNLFL